MSLISYLREETDAVLARDPAAKSRLEVFLCYPGFHAILMHRVSHWLWGKKFFLLSRMLANFNRFMTGVEIHPRATIGRRVFIDHGMGVVIGETAEIRDDVTLYHGVTLGGVSLKKEKRHPTIEEGAVIGTGAKVLGPFTVGRGAQVGANSVVVRAVPAETTVVGIPAAAVKMHTEASELHHDHIANPMASAMNDIVKRMAEMEKEIETLKKQIELLDG